MSYLAFFLYRHFLVPLVWFFLQLIAWVKPGKIRDMVKAKNSQNFYFHNTNESEIKSKKPFWIHAASGEIEYARPVMRELKKEFPNIPILVTYSSPSAKKILQNIPEIDAWGALPWDLPWLCQNFLNRFQPRAWLVARTDVWPEISLAVQNKKIPSLLFSATFSEHSSRLSGLAKYLTKFSLNNLNDIFVVSDEDAQQLQKLKLTKSIEICGDTRFDQVLHRLKNPKPLKDQLKNSHDKIFVCGSIWPEDEKIILPAIAQAKIKTILAPHELHLEHLQKLESQLKTLNLSFSYYSKSETWTTDVLILDVIGILAEVYTWGHIAFVGGSFRRQVHSVMEPLAAGLPVFVGPYHTNNREAVLWQNKTCQLGTMVTCLRTEIEFSEKLKQFMSQNETQTLKSEILRSVQKNEGSSKQVIAWAKKVT